METKVCKSGEMVRDVREWSEMPFLFPCRKNACILQFYICFSAEAEFHAQRLFPQTTFLDMVRF